MNHMSYGVLVWGLRFAILMIAAEIAIVLQLAIDAAYAPRT